MNMRCKEAERWISVRVDGEAIPASKAEGLDRHLGECADCRELLADERRRAGAIESMLEAGLPSDDLLGAAVAEEALRRPVAAAGSRRFLPRAVLAMAAGILILLGLRLTVFDPDRFILDRPPSTAVGAYRPSVLDFQTVHPQMVTSDEGEPYERGVKNQHWIYRFPRRTPEGWQVILDVQNEKTEYLKPANWTYH